MKKQMNEVEYLMCEAEAAKSDMRGKLQELKIDVAAAANPAGWVRQYPWPALGVASVAGLLAARALLRKRRRDRLEEEFPWLFDGHRRERDDEEKSNTRASAARPGILASAMSAALGSLVSMLRPTIENALRSMVSRTHEGYDTSETPEPPAGSYSPSACPPRAGD